MIQQLVCVPAPSSVSGRCVTGILGGNLRRAMALLREKGHTKVVVLRSECTLALGALQYFEQALSWVKQVSDPRRSNRAERGHLCCRIQTCGESSE